MKTHDQKRKILNALLIATSLIGYLEWGDDQSTYIFQAEWDILMKLGSQPREVLHPLIVLPLVGQILLAITLFQKHPSSLFTYLGRAGLGVLLIFIGVIGVAAKHWEVALSTLPFLLVLIIASVYSLRYKKSEKLT